MPVRIKELRDEKGLTQEELATILNCGNSTIANYETGNRTPDLATLCRMADFFEVTLDFLAGRSTLRSLKIDFMGIEISDENIKDTIVFACNAVVDLVSKGVRPEDAKNAIKIAAGVLTNEINNKKGR